MATIIAIANVGMVWGCMERMPGMPPTPMAFAVVPVETQRTAAQAEPVMPQIKGKKYLRLTPKIAGSVTPR